MNAQEAIKRIMAHKFVHFKSEERAIKITEALDMAIEALKKQIPKKVDGVCGEYKNAKCPICHSGLRFPDEYCSWCGQKLDWGDNYE